MKFIFKDNANTELILPVTPKDFEIQNGINIETVNIHALGDIIIAGYRKLGGFKIPCLLPARDYPFAHVTGKDPYEYVERFNKWCQERVALRFIISDTPVNTPALIESVQYGEKDGTGDVYMTLNLREYREISMTQTQKREQTGNATREEPAARATADTYVVVKGDTLSAISRKFYGDASLCYVLADFNAIKNANLIFPGQSIKIPSKELLKGVA